ncbi:MAG TPA: gluconate 2-dehydrogenase subunit 3 family protein [Bryobacteraceae bacterium]|nr:gluconate 2-dehydrogenase subunit 3 family protein [Bryobacteraceae bacterium]
MSTNRRETLKIIGAIGATCAFPYASDELYGQHVHVAGQAVEFGPPVFFKANEFAMVSRVADLIIPATDSPGALLARVPSYIDLVVSRNVEHQSVYRQGLAWLESQRFMELTEAQQIAILEPLCAAADEGRAANAGEIFFRAIKNMTADGYYTSKAGLATELGFTGGAVLAQFPSCEVPEH